MGMQIPRSLDSQVSEEDAVWATAPVPWPGIQGSGPQQRVRGA